MPETERSTFIVSPTGVGRKDYSQDIQTQVEPLVRSHQTRNAWSVRAYLPTYEFGVNYWATLIHFTDEDLNLQLYAPDKPKYILYDFNVESAQNALVENGLSKIQKMETWADPMVLIEDIFRVYSYGSSRVKLTKGYVVEPGYTYIHRLSCYTEEPVFFVTANIYGLDDTIIEGG